MYYLYYFWSNIIIFDKHLFVFKKKLNVQSMGANKLTQSHPSNTEI